MSRDLVIQADRILSVNTLDDAARSLSGRVVDFTKQFLRLTLTEGVAPGTPVKISTDDFLLLGEICYCAPTDNEFRATLRVQHLIPDTRKMRELMRLVRESVQPDGRDAVA